MAIYCLYIVLTFFLMEFVAWFTHKYIMHGFLWCWHKDHHVKTSKGFFQHNDLFFLLFALPSMICFLIWSITSYTWLLCIGLGIVLYGMVYFMVHDIFIHRRFKIFKNTQNTYLRAIRKAHKVHHKHLIRVEGECFGLLLVPLKYYKEVLKKCEFEVKK